jgi:hypothetical protein
MKEYLIRAVLLSLFSYFLLGNVEEIVLLAAVLLFVALFISKVQDVVLSSLKANLVELERLYSFLFSLQQTKIYIRYFSLLKLKEYLFFSIFSTFSLTKLTLC